MFHISYQGVVFEARKHMNLHLSVDQIVFTLSKEPVETLIQIVLQK